MILITYSNDNIIVTSNKLISGKLILKNMDNEIFIIEEFKTTSFIRTKINSKILGTIKVELMTENKTFKKLITK